MVVCVGAVCVFGGGGEVNCVNTLSLEACLKKCIVQRKCAMCSCSL